MKIYKLTVLVDVEVQDFPDVLQPLRRSDFDAIAEFDDFIRFIAVFYGSVAFAEDGRCVVLKKQG